VNLIKNIGVDERSEHGGVSYEIPGTAIYAPSWHGTLNISNLNLPPYWDIKARKMGVLFDASLSKRIRQKFGINYILFYLLVIKFRLHESGYYIHKHLEKIWGIR
jgi:hypothetical protein